MALAFADRVKETTTTTGTGTITLAGASAGYQSFSAIGNGNTTYYTIAAGSQWEVGVGTYTAAGTTLSRDTVLASSNGGALVNFSAGVKDVFCDYPAGKAVIQDASGNVGIGTASPASKLDVNGTTTTGNITVRGDGVEGGQITFNNLGNTASPLILDVDGFGRGRLFTTANNADLILGQLIGTGGVVTFSTSGVERMRVDTSGNLGIGTSAPTDLLDVNATTASTGYNDFVAFRQVNGAGTHSRILFGQNSTNSMFIEVANQANTKGNLLLQPFGGNVGVGTGSPAFNLDITGTGRFTGLTQFDNDVTLNKATLNYLYFNDALAFARNGVGERMRIDTSGNVGIGTNSPSSRLTVQGDELIIPAAGWTSGQAARLYLGDTANGIQNVNGSYQTYFAFNGHSWNVNGSEAMRIDGSRNVGIGTSTPGYRLDVSGVINTNAAVRMTPTNVGAFTRAQLQSAYNLDGTGASVFTWNYTNGGGELDLFINRNGGGTGGLKIYDFPNTSGDPTNIFTVEGGGNVGIGTASPATSLSVVTNTTSHIGMRVTNNSTTQFAGSGLQMLGPSAAGTQGGAAIYYYNTTVGGTQGGMAMAQLANNGSFQRNLAYYSFNDQTWAFLTNSTERLSITSGGSVGIGTSSPATTLDVAGAIRSSTGASDPGTGTVLYFVGSGSFQTVVAGAAFAVHTGNNNARTERMRIDINGNAGIGTSSPGAKLDVTTASGANIVVSRSSAAGYAAFQRIAPAGQQVYDFYTINNTEAGRITVDGSNFMAFSTGSSATERMRITSTGDVGIGTNSPNSKLDVVAASGYVDIRVRSNTTQAFVAADTSAITMGTYNAVPYLFSTNNTERMRITSAGNVGIGTSAPASLLHVKQSSDAIEVYPSGTWAGRVINAADAAGFNGLLVGNRWAGTGSTVFEAGSIFGGGTGSWYSYYRIDGVGQSIWSNAGTERMRLDTSGNVGIGTSSPAGRLDVLSTSAGGASFMRVANGSGAANSYAAISLDPGNNGFNTRDAQIRAINNGSNQISLTFLTSNAGTPFEAMRINNAGNVGIGTASPGARLDVAGGSIRVGNTHAMTFRNAAGTGTATYTLQSDDNFVVYNAAGTPISSFTQGSTNIAVYGSNGSNRMQVDSINNVTYWTVNGSERMRINPSGELLVGTTSGGRSLCLYGSDVWQRIHNPSRSWLIGLGTGSNFVIYDETGGGPRLTVEPATGNWIGPNSILLGSGQNNDNKIEIGTGRTGNNFAYVDLIGDTTYTDFGLRLLRGNGGPNTYSQLVHRGTGDMYITAQDAATLYFQTNATTRAYFQSDGTMVMSGALLVGRNTTGSNVNTNNDTGSFSVRGDGSNAASMSFHRTGAYAINMGLGTDAVFRIGGWSASSNCFQMDGSGNLTMLGNVTAYSDARIKKDVETIGSALDLVSKMRGVRYTRIDSGKRGVGVIAQEMLEVVPEVVQQGVGDDDTLSVAYGNLVGVLIEAIKELRAEIVELKGK